MIFADKLIDLRKKNSWTQEELAEKMGVSRQSITKWESAQSVPELSKLLRLSELFGVSLDYLLKDEIEVVDNTGDGEDEKPLRRVSLAETNRFLQAARQTAGPIAVGVLLCVLSPICLLLMAVISEMPSTGLSENMAAGLGLCVMLVLVATAVAIFIKSGSKTEDYKYLEKEAFDTEYGVVGMVKELKSQFKPRYDRNVLCGVVFCILSVLPLFIGAALFEDNDYNMVKMVCLMLFLAGIGVGILVHTSLIWSSYNQILQEGDYTIEQKMMNSSLLGTFSSAYWLVATAAYLVYSFTTNDWKNTWIVWPVAGVLYPAVRVVVRLLVKSKN